MTNTMMCFGDVLKGDTFMYGGSVYIRMNNPLGIRCEVTNKSEHTRLYETSIYNVWNITRNQFGHFKLGTVVKYGFDDFVHVDKEAAWKACAHHLCHVLWHYYRPWKIELYPDAALMMLTDFSAKYGVNWFVLRDNATIDIPHAYFDARKTIHMVRCGTCPECMDTEHHEFCSNRL